QIQKSADARAKFWKRDTSSADAFTKSGEPNRARLAHILGLRDRRVPFDAPELIATTSQPALVGKGAGFEAFAVRWPAFGDVHGEGLLLVPTGKKVADVVAIPDADQTPEQLGDAELAAMLATQSLVVENTQAPEVTLPGQGGAPARLELIPRKEVEAEWARFEKLVPKDSLGGKRVSVVGGVEGHPFASEE